ncbi:RraA family protein [Bordetella petrii]|uniref:RraA family protein n=1 Tax=Bordetella petrii TaxID=94624 RepID=UPI001A95C91C|nr:RraA family protein [Bordetella petrii]MBO1112653.1 RraA family protein [Bordetella petrii]
MADPAPTRPQKPLTGRVPPQAVRCREFPALPADVLQRYARIEDLTATASDAMDNLGLAGVVPASVLAPQLAAARLAGQAVTVRNTERPDAVGAAAQAGQSRMGEHEAYNLAEPGNVVVIEGLPGVSNLGGQSASVAHRAGCAGAIVDGGFRDPRVSRALGFPIWSRGVTPVTGKWRLQTAEINGRVRIGGVAVEAGDLVLADESGVAFVPYAQAQAVLQEMERIQAGDHRQQRDIAAGVDLQTLASTKYK